MIMNCHLSVSQHGRVLVDLSQDLLAEQHHGYLLATTAVQHGSPLILINQPSDLVYPLDASSPLSCAAGIDDPRYAMYLFMCHWGMGTTRIY